MGVVFAQWRAGRRFVGTPRHALRAHGALSSRLPWPSARNRRLPCNGAIRRRPLGLLIRGRPAARRRGGAAVKMEEGHWAWAGISQQQDGEALSVVPTSTARLELHWRPASGGPSAFIQEGRHFSLKQLPGSNRTIGVDDEALDGRTVGGQAHAPPTRKVRQTLRELQNRLQDAGGQVRGVQKGVSEIVA
jgi:hypothetical protein